LDLEQTQQASNYLNKSNNKNDTKKSNKKKVKTPTKSPNKLKDYFLNEYQPQEAQVSSHQFPFARFDSSSNAFAASSGVYYPGHIRAPVFQSFGSSSFSHGVTTELSASSSLLTSVPSQITPLTNKKLANKLLKRNKKFIKDLETSAASSEPFVWPQQTSFEPEENLKGKKTKQNKSENLDNLDEENENVPSKTKMSRRKNAKNLLSSANYHINSVAKAEKDELVFEITNEEGLCVQAKDINSKLTFLKSFEFTSI